VALLSEQKVGCGIYVEWLNSIKENIDQFAISDEERDIYESNSIAADPEWLFRIWCAKVSSGKALGGDLFREPKDLKVQNLDCKTGTVNLEISARLTHQLPHLNGKRLQAQTLRDGDLIVASSIITKKEGVQDE
jgi:phosphopantetheinyl transferase